MSQNDWRAVDRPHTEREFQPVYYYKKDRKRSRRRNGLLRAGVCLGLIAALIAAAAVLARTTRRTKPADAAGVPVQAVGPTDTVAPVITGARDITVFLGESIVYRDGVTVSDDTDPAPSLDIDSSGVDMSRPGVYTAVYTAADAAGNTVSKNVTVTIREKPADFVEEADAYAAARPYYDEIISDGMTDMQKAFAIYRWVKGFIYYVDHSDHTYWTMGAQQAFTELAGDCFIYYSAAKAMLNMAGIQNMDIVKSDTSRSQHYWLLINLGYGWYHFDACPRAGDAPDNTFMLTDEELAVYSQLHDNSHIYDPTLYPARATQSVQQYVDYENHRVTDPGWQTAAG